MTGPRQIWGEQASETRSVIRVDTWGDSSALPHPGALIWGPSSLHWQDAHCSDFSFFAPADNRLEALTLLSALHDPMEF